MDIKITDEALNDVAQIINYIAKENPFAAQKLQNKLYKAFKRIGAFPYSGLDQSIFKRHVRSILCDQNMIFYYISHDSITIIGVLGKGQSKDHLLSRAHEMP